MQPVTFQPERAGQLGGNDPRCEQWRWQLYSVVQQNNVLRLAGVPDLGLAEVRGLRVRGSTI